jgi:hypothetical protein
VEIDRVVAINSQVVLSKKRTRFERFRTTQLFVEIVDLLSCPVCTSDTHSIIVSACFLLVGLVLLLYGLRLLARRLRHWRSRSLVSLWLQPAHLLAHHLNVCLQQADLVVMVDASVVLGIDLISLLAILHNTA